MNKLFKGAVAGAAGVALLLGGAGTFALWNDGVSIGASQEIHSGQLQFGDVPTGTWTLNGAPVADIDDVLIVPGDVLVYTVNGVEVLAQGNTLDATFGVDFDQMTGDADLLGQLDHTVAISQNSTALGDTVTVSPAAGVQEYDVVVTITFDAATAGLLAQNQTVSLDGAQLTLQQVIV